MTDEVNWDWDTIFILAMARLAPNGVELNVDDVVALPMDRTLIEERDATGITFSWKTLEEAEALRNPLIIQREKPSVSRLEGRYMKLACILLWKRAKDGIRLSVADERHIPIDRFLFEDGIEYKWVTVDQALKIRNRERDSEGRANIVSKGAL